MATVVELYRNGHTDKDNIDKLISDAAGSASRKELCQSLGLGRQAQHSGASPEDAAVFYPRLSTYELAVWSGFLPTSHSKAGGGWADYDHDLIPRQVLEETRLADALNVFDDLEIWTPGRFDRDPMIVGIVGQRPIDRNWLPALRGGGSANTGEAHFFGIARWGESLEPFETIERLVRSRLIEQQPMKQSDLGQGAQVAIYERTRAGDGLQPVDFHVGSMFRRHCGKPGLLVNKRESICWECGTLIKKHW